MNLIIYIIRLHHSTS